MNNYRATDISNAVYILGARFSNFDHYCILVIPCRSGDNQRFLLVRMIPTFSVSNSGVIYLSSNFVFVDQHASELHFSQSTFLGIFRNTEIFRTCSFQKVDF